MSQFGGGWNYRLFSKRVEGRFDDCPEFFIGEAYYDEHGQVTAWSDAVAPHGDTPEEVRDDLKLMVEALDKPILDHDDGKEAS